MVAILSIAPRSEHHRRAPYIHALSINDGQPRAVGSATSKESFQPLDGEDTGDLPSDLPYTTRPLRTIPEEAGQIVDPESGRIYLPHRAPGSSVVSGTAA